MTKYFKINTFTKSLHMYCLTLFCLDATDNLQKEENLSKSITKTIKTTALSWVYFFEAVTKRNGCYNYVTGNIYNGEMTFFLPNGQGSCIYPSGDSYTGEWQFGKKHGQGTYKWADGDSYTGKWETDLQHGQGTYKRTTGNSYTGEWQKGQKHGQGTYKSATGNSYTGQWVNNWPGTHRKNTKIVPLHDLKNISKLGQIFNSNEHAKKGVIFQATADYNGAFQPHKETCQKISQVLKSGKFDVEYQFFSNKNDLENKIKALSDNISLVWLRAHGGGKTFDCGPGKSGNIHTLSFLEKKLSPEPIIILESCQTGEKGQLGEELRDYLCEKNFTPTVIAPNGSPAYRGINIEKLESGNIDIIMVDLSARNITRFLTCSK